MREHFKIFHAIEDHKEVEERVVETADAANHAVTCEECWVEFIEENFLIVHKASAHTSDKITCQICYAMLPSQERLEDHKRHVHGEGDSGTHIRDTPNLIISQTAKNQACKACGWVMPIGSNLNSHIRLVHKINDESVKNYRMVVVGSATVACDQCGSQFANETYRDLHQCRGKIDQCKAKACKVCGWVLEMKSFKSTTILKRHITVRHSVHKDCANDYIIDILDPSEVSTCNQCHSNYSSSDFLKRHKDCCAKESLMSGKPGTQHLVGHGEKKSSTIEPRLLAIPLMADSPCKVCGKIFEDNIQLFGHLQCDHKFDRQLSEQFASEKMIVKPSLARSCNVCHQQFVNAEYLDAHSCVKHIKEVACITCGKVFDGASLLSAHFQSDHSMTKEAADQYSKAVAPAKLKEKCIDCKEIFSSTRFLKQHSCTAKKESEETSVPPMPLLADTPCKLCGIIFEDNVKLFRHLQGDHKLGRALSEQYASERIEARTRTSCDLCHESFTSDEFFRMHECSKCTSRVFKNRSCKVCGVVAKTFNAMLQHLRTAHGTESIDNIQVSSIGKLHSAVGS